MKLQGRSLMLLIRHLSVIGVRIVNNQGKLLFIREPIDIIKTN